MSGSGPTDISSLNAFTQSQDTKNSTLATYTGSVDTQFVAVGSSTSSLNSATASLFTSASLAVVTASFSGNTLTFTKGNNTTFGVTIPDVSGSTIPAGTISGSSQITALGFVSSSVTGSSLITGSVAGNVLTFTKGDATQFSLTVATGSGGGSTDTGSLMVTGSVNVNVLTFTKGDGSTFDLTVAASGSSPAGTVSSSQQILNYNIFATTGSNDFVGTQNISSSGDGITLLGYGNRLNFGGTQTTDRAWLNLAESDGTNQGTALQFAGVNTGVSFTVNDSETPSTGSTPVAFENTSRSGSILFQNSGNTGQIRLQNNTGSINLQAGGVISISGSLTRIQDVNFIPFSASLDSRILAITGSSINTGSFATTGSNIFIGDQTITGSVNVSGGEHLFIKRSTAGANQLLRLGATDNENNFAFIVTGSDTNPGQQVWGINTMGGTWGNSFDAGVVFNSYVTASQGLNVGDAGTFSAPLQNGYVWVGNSSGRNTTAPTSSFGGSTDTGSLMRTGSVSGNVLTFTKGDASTFTLTVATGSGGSTIDTGSFATTGSNTFVGNQTIQNADLRISGSILFPNSAEIRGNAGTQTIFNSPSSLKISCSVNATIAASDLTLNATLINVRGVETIGDIAGTSTGEVYLLGRSGSLVIGNSTATPTYAALAHLSSSQINGNTNLIFKTNGSTGDTIISGSGNIFTNPTTPTTGYKRYIGGANNLYLNSTNGITSQITQSATTVSGTTAAMNNNIFNGTGTFVINQAVNGGTLTLNNNIIGGTGTNTINALGFTGSLSVSSNFNNNGTITANAASASVTEITSGLSGSGGFNINNNGIFGGTITATSPRTLLTSVTQNITGNILAQGVVTVTNISSSAQVSATSNIGPNSFVYSNAGAAGLALHTTAGSMSTNYGAMSLIASASAISANANISPTAVTVTNRMFSGSLGVGSLTFNNNQAQGNTNTYTITGSFGGTGSPSMLGNGIFGSVNTIFTNVEGRGMYVDFRSNLVGGHALILTGSNNNAITGSGGGYFGRFNANDGRRNGTAENILVVGTGTSADNRKTGFLIDSGSNTFVEGSFNVSGSTSMTGSLTISGSTQFTGSISIAPTFEAKFATGSNQQAGTAVLDGANPGTVTVSNSLVTANSIIMLTKQTLTNAHMVAVSSKGAGTFTITSNGNGDADTVGWFIINNS